MRTSDITPYLARVLGTPVTDVEVRPLGGGAGDDVKRFGYGVPLAVRCRAGGVPRELVISRTRPVAGFGHDYPADRAWQAVFSHAAFNSFPRHARSLDVGCALASGTLESLGGATEFFQVVEKIDGTLYKLDLERLLEGDVTDRDVVRAVALARFLADAHAVKGHDAAAGPIAGDEAARGALYARRIRELVGHGECLMGILDSYPHPYAPLPPAACEAIERAAVRWRWRLRGRVDRLSRVHGDFHPWNILFRDGADFTLLDRSRGEWGEPADDVAALAINYLFFGLLRGAREGRAAVVAEPFHALFRTFLDTYEAASGDHDLPGVMPPFLAFRAFVLAHPRWYPGLDTATRAALIRFGRAMVESTRVNLDEVSATLGAAA
jgi:CBS domain-containing protein